MLKILRKNQNYRINNCIREEKIAALTKNIVKVVQSTTYNQNNYFITVHILFEKK